MCGTAGGAAVAPASKSGVRSKVARRPTRRSKVTAPLHPIPQLSHWPAPEAMVRRSCPVLLEVPRCIHDIFAQANGPVARARGDQMANWQDPRMTGVNAATVGVPRATRDA